MDDDEIQEVYKWIDGIHLSRPKRNITRDFSDGVLVAEVVKSFLPRLVEVHNYQPASSLKQKMENWKTLNHKVFKKLRLNIPENVMQGVVQMKQGVIEVVLNSLRLKIQEYLSPPAVREIDDGSRDNRNVYEGRSVNDYRGSTMDSRNSDGHMSHRSMNRHSNSQHIQQQNQSQQPMLPQIDVTRGSKHTTGGRSNKSFPKTKSFPGPSRKTPNNHPSANGIDKTGMDLYDLLHQKETELLDANETINVLEAKIEKLQQLLKLKDRKINDLTSRLG